MIKEGSFECHDAKIKTRELEYRNQTWSVRKIAKNLIRFLIASVVRRTRQPVYTFKYGLARLGEDGLPSAFGACSSSGPRVIIQD